MSNDQELLTELRAAFHDSTEQLTYAGRRRPHRTTPALVSLAAASVVIGAVAANGLADQRGVAPGATSTPPPTPPSSASRTAAPLITEKVELAGFTVRYQRRAGEPEPLHVELRSGNVPAGLEKVTLPGGRAAFTGRDPRTGASAVFVEDFVRAAGKPDGRVFVLLSSSMSAAELVSLFDPALAVPVPLVER